MSERVLVTGAAGFIGRWVIKELLDRGYEVKGFDDLSGGSRENVSAFEDNERFSFTEGDIRNNAQVDEQFVDLDCCLHLAAEIDVHESLEEPDTHFQTNVVGTQHVLEACRRTDTRLTLLGTCMVYDVARADTGIDEQHPTDPASPYAGTKLASEEIAMSYYHGYDLPVTVLRPFNTYGPFQRSGTAGGVVSIFTSRDINGETLKIYGDGTQTRDLLYVTDCARFIVDATESEAAIGEVINAGTGKDVSVNELAELIATGETDIEHVEHHHPQSEIDRLRCDPSKAEDVLGWEPRVSLPEGVDRLRTWMQTREK